MHQQMLQQFQLENQSVLFQKKNTDSDLLPSQQREELQQFKKFSDDIRTYIVDESLTNTIIASKIWQRYQTESKNP